MNLINMTWAFVQATVRAKIKDERGASLVEYALLLALIAVVCIVALNLIGSGAKSKLSSVASELD